MNEDCTCKEDSQHVSVKVSRPSSPMSLHSDLILLQGKVKEDPEIYREDAMKHFKHFLTQYEIYQLKPSKEHKEFSSLVKFLSAIAACYPEELKDFPSQIAGLLEQNSLILEPGLRIILVRSLILLRNKNLLSPTRYVLRGVSLISAHSQSAVAVLQAVSLS